VRIISGIYKGIRFHPPKGLKARPTTDFAKENLFNVLEHSIELKDITVLDLFAGTGSISYEFMSRGCASVTSIDTNQRHIDFIKQTAATLSPTVPIVMALRTDVFQFLKRNPLHYDLIFADPPFDLKGIENIPKLVFKKTSNPNTLLIVEHSSKTFFEKHPNFDQIRSYGKVNFSFFRSKASHPDDIPEAT